MGKGKKDMKKIFILLLVIVMAVSLSVTAFAEDNTISYDESKESQTSGLSVTYNVAPTFTVVIPASVTLGNSVTVSAEDVVVEYGNAVTVTLSGTSESDNSFKLRTDEGAVISYAVTKGGVDVTVGDTVLSAIPTSAETSAELTFTEPASYTYAGIYKGTVTFTIAVETVGNN